MPTLARRYGSWSRLPLAGPVQASAPGDPRAPLAEAPSGSLLPFGAGRTYGDTCVSKGGSVIDTRNLRGIQSFDPASGRMRCLAGTTLAEVLAHAVPSGWFPPVCPGTRHVTVGGAIAHDVHGKNHPLAGTFGLHVQGLELVRSDGRHLACSASEHEALFRATLGGLGLTGLIVAAELQLRPLRSSAMEVEEARLTDLPSFLAEPWSSDEYEYGLLWVDSFRDPRRGARCVSLRGRHASDGPATLRTDPPRRGSGLPVPAALFNRATLRAFNALYYWGAHRAAPRRARRHFAAVLFPQDGVHASNRAYGSRGVYAYHCLIPTAQAPDAVPALLARVARRGEQSLVTVLKPFGAARAPGLLSFTGAGISCVFGFPNEGRRTLDLLADLDALVAAAGGKLYPAKDARMPPSMFRSSFPRWEEFAGHVDPRFSSSFWERVSARDGELRP
jgi:FAD/FMN-containing dehydrogenase